MNRDKIREAIEDYEDGQNYLNRFGGFVKVENLRKRKRGYYADIVIKSGVGKTLDQYTGKRAVYYPFEILHKMGLEGRL